MLIPKNNTNRHLRFKVKPNKVSQKDLDCIAKQIEIAVWQVYNNFIGRSLNKRVKSLEINAEIYIKPYEEFILNPNECEGENGTVTSGQ